MKFLSPEYAVCLYKYTILPCMKYCCHIWVCAPSCYLAMLNKLQKQVCKTAEPLLSSGVIVEMQPIYVISINIILVNNHLKWLNWFHLLIILVFPLLRDVFVTIPSCYKDVCVSSFFPCTAGLWTLDSAADFYQKIWKT